MIVTAAESVRLLTVSALVDSSESELISPVMQRAAGVFRADGFLTQAQGRTVARVQFVFSSSSLCCPHIILYTQIRTGNVLLCPLWSLKKYFGP